MVLGITEKLGASGRGEKKTQKRRKRTDRRKSLCFFSLGGKKEVASAGKFLRG